MPTGSDTFFSLSFVNTNDVDDFVLGEDRVDIDWLFEHGSGVIDLIADAATIDLDFHDVRLLASQWKKFHLVEIFFDLLLTIFILPLAASLAEGLLLGFVPVLVESSLAFFTDVLSKDGLQGTETTGSFDVSDATNYNHGWCFQNCNSINNLLFVDL